MFDPRALGEDVAGLLALEGNGERLLPLVHGDCRSKEARAKVKAAKVAPLLRAGLYVYFDCWDEAHTVAQEIDTAEGSYWHGIVHRQEPDAGNAGYWFRRVGNHPIYPKVRQAAEPILRSSETHPQVAKLARSSDWNPSAMIELCTRPDGQEMAIVARSI